MRTTWRRALAGAVAGAMLLLGAGAGVAAAAEDAQRRLPPIASVDVVGSGPVAWGAVVVRSAPRPDAPVVRTLSQFRPDFRPRWVMAVGSRAGADGEPAWYQITLPGRPNGQRGWVPAGSVSLRPVDRWLVIYRDSRRFELYVDRKVRRSGPVAIGARGMETPIGLFYVQSRFTPRAYPILGAYAFETSGYSKLSDWPGGGVVGVHGTNSPALIGQAVSHGCVRLHNADVLALRALVRPGTPVKIVRG